MDIGVGIVLYNADKKILDQSISSLLSKVKFIFLVDNASNNIRQLERKYAQNKKVILIKNKDNLGIAYALNQIFNLANEKGLNYLLTLDQDSVLSETSLDKMLDFRIMENVALISPIINDLNRDREVQQEEDYIDIERCITSGTLMNLSICSKIGLFDEKMFIDYVDFEYCKRVKIAGKRIIRVKDAVINHEIGKRSKRRFLFWTVYPTNHNAMRVYYYSRNIRYYCLKFKNNMTFIEKQKELLYLLWKLTSILLYEKEKKEKIKMYFKGLKDAKAMNKS